MKRVNVKSALRIKTEDGLCQSHLAIIWPSFVSVVVHGQDQRFEVVKNFRYLNSEINGANDIGEETNICTASGNGSFYTV